MDRLELKDVRVDDSTLNDSAGQPAEFNDAMSCGVRAKALEMFGDLGLDLEGLEAIEYSSTWNTALNRDRLRLDAHSDSIGITQVTGMSTGLTSSSWCDIDLATGLTITWIVATARLLPPRTLALLPQLEAHAEYVEGYSFLGEYHAKP